MMQSHMPRPASIVTSTSILSYLGLKLSASFCYNPDYYAFVPSAFGGGRPSAPLEARAIAGVVAGMAPHRIWSSLYDPRYQPPLPGMGGRRGFLPRGQSLLLGRDEFDTEHLLSVYLSRPFFWHATGRSPQWL